MSTRTYQIGFFLSIVVTLAAFGLVHAHQTTGHLYPTHTQLFVALAVLAVVQIVVQLVYFLHLGRSTRGRDFVALALAVGIVMLVVGGSLWIMASLNHNTPANPNQVLFPNGVSPQNQND